MQQNMNSNLGPYVTSAFSRHGLLATVGIVARLSSGIAQIPMAKIGDIWGRMEIYILVHGLTSFGASLRLCVFQSFSDQQSRPSPD